MLGLYRLSLLLLLLGSLGLGYKSFIAIAENPALTPLIARSSDEIAAWTDRLIAAEATPERLAELMSRRLAEAPRNWVALQALADLHAQRGFPLPPGP
ncbi:MAG: hypothetical protein ACK4OK_08135 [Thermoflexus sp.]